MLGCSDAGAEGGEGFALAFAAALVSTPLRERVEKTSESLSPTAMPFVRIPSGVVGADWWNPPQERVCGGRLKMVSMMSNAERSAPFVVVGPPRRVGEGEDEKAEVVG